MEDNSLDIICAICLNKFTDPKFLPCFHSFCKKCLEDLGSRQGWKSVNPEIQCPVCRQSVKVPKGGVKNFQSNFYVRNDLVRIQCERCDIEAQFLCINCGHLCCSACKQDHALSRVSRQHRIVKLSNMEMADILRIKQKTYCKIHTRDEVKFACLKCNKSLICYTCHSMEHQGHSTVDISSAASGERERIKKELEENKVFFETLRKDYQEKLNIFESQTTEIDTEIQNLQKKKEEIISLINSCFDSGRRRIKCSMTYYVAVSRSRLNVEDESIRKLQNEIEALKNKTELINDAQLMMKVKDVPTTKIEKAIPNYHTYSRAKESIKKVQECLENIYKELERWNSTIYETARFEYDRPATPQPHSRRPKQKWGWPIR